MIGLSIHFGNLVSWKQIWPLCDTSSDKFLSDPGPIIVYPCHSLTDWLTDSLTDDLVEDWMNWPKYADFADYVDYADFAECA